MFISSVTGFDLEKLLNVYYYNVHNCYCERSISTVK